MSANPPSWFARNGDKLFNSVTALTTAVTAWAALTPSVSKYVWIPAVCGLVGTVATAWHQIWFPSTPRS